MTNKKIIIMENKTKPCISSLDGRYAKFMSEPIQYLSEEALIIARVKVELLWLQELTQKVPAINDLVGEFVASYYEEKFIADCISSVKKYEETTKHDVKAVEYHIRNCLIKEGLSKLIPYLHFGCTSEDINNLAYAISYTHVLNNIVLPLVDIFQNILKSKMLTKSPMLSHTHGQVASPTTMEKEYAVYRDRVKSLGLKNIRFGAKFSGATGTYAAWACAYPDIDWPALCSNFIGSFDLDFIPISTQINPCDNVIMFLDKLRHLSLILTGMAQDQWQYLSKGYIRLSTTTGSIGSSTMPHKINPIDFENAEGNFTMVVGLCETITRKLAISRMQRDLSGSTVMRNIGSVIGHFVLAIGSLNGGLSKIEPDAEVMLKELDMHWEVLTEAVQTLLRKEGVPDAYEIVKDLLPIGNMSRQHYLSLIDTLKLHVGEKIYEEVYKTLIGLTPANYTGYATVLSTKY